MATINGISTITNQPTTGIPSRKRRLSEDSWSEGGEEEPTKLIRVQPTNLSPASPSVKFSCTLPPTCHQPPNHPHQYFTTADQLESHHRTHHTHICAHHHQPQLIFPDERFLNLHFRECHDPLLQLAREQGQRTFACFEYSCNRLFHTPKTRRLHLIDAHHYPPTFNFSLPNHGLTSLYHKHGDAVSLLRPEWSPQSESPSHSSPPKGLANSTLPTAKEEVPTPMVIESPVIPDSTPIPKHSRPTSPREPTSAISLLSGFDRLSLVPRQVQLSRIASQSRGKANS